MLTSAGLGNSESDWTVDAHSRVDVIYDEDAPAGADRSESDENDDDRSQLGAWVSVDIFVPKSKAREDLT
jgi:hypothetical protein